MMSCWAAHPRQRPVFVCLVKELFGLLDRDSNYLKLLTLEIFLSWWIIYDLNYGFHKHVVCITALVMYTCISLQMLLHVIEMTIFRAVFLAEVINLVAMCAVTTSARTCCACAS